MPERIVIQCPECAAKFGITDRSTLGKSVRCPKCSENFIAQELAKSKTSAKNAETYRADEVPDDDDKPKARRGQPTSKLKTKGLPLGAIVGGAIGCVIVVGGTAYFLSGPKPDPVVVQSNTAPANNAVETTAASPSPQAAPQSEQGQAPELAAAVATTEQTDATQAASGEQAPTPTSTLTVAALSDPSSITQAAVASVATEKPATSASGTAPTPNPTTTPSSESAVAIPPADAVPGTAATPDQNAVPPAVATGKESAQSAAPLAGSTWSKRTLITPGEPEPLPSVPGNIFTMNFSAKVDGPNMARVQERLRRLFGSQGRPSNKLYSDIRLEFKDVDAEAMAKRIDFGKVSQMDSAKKSFVVTIDYKRLLELEPESGIPVAVFGKNFNLPPSLFPFGGSPVDAIKSLPVVKTDVVPLEPTTIGDFKLVPQSVANDRVKLLMPTTFKLKPHNSKLTKSFSLTQPQFVFRNEKGTVTISINQTKQPVVEDGLPNLVGAMAMAFSKTLVGDCRTQIVEIDSRRHGELLFNSKVRNTEFVNHIIMRGYQGELLIVTANATPDEFPAYKDAIEACLLSLQAQ